MPWSVEATSAVQSATRLAADTGARAAEPIHLLVALAQEADGLAEILRSHGSIDAPVAGETADALRLPQVEGAAEQFAQAQGQSVRPGHLLVALLDQGDSDVRQALATNQLDPRTVRRAALQAVGAAGDLPALAMPDLRWGLL